MPRSDLSVSSPPAPPAPRRLWTAPLLQREAIGCAYHVLTFEAEAPIAALPGQFAMIRSTTWGSDPLLPRPMSLLTAGERPSILIKVVGQGTRRMANASSGEVFELLAPLGRPWSDFDVERAPRVESARRPILVAGGVGVAPLLFLARALSARAPAHKALALYGSRSIADLPLDADLAAVSELRIATEDGSRGTKGRVTVILEEALREHAAAGIPVKVYTCGPEAMMAAVATLCASLDVPCEVSLETPMACGYGVCLGCPVPRSSEGFLYACTEGPCIDAAAIAWKRSAK